MNAGEQAQTAPQAQKSGGPTSSIEAAVRAAMEAAAAAAWNAGTHAAGSHFLSSSHGTGGAAGAALTAAFGGPGSGGGEASTLALPPWSAAEFASSAAFATPAGGDGMGLGGWSGYSASSSASEALGYEPGFPQGGGAAAQEPGVQKKKRGRPPIPDELKKPRKVGPQKSTYTGVSWHSSSQLWMVQYRNGEKRVCVGYFKVSIGAMCCGGWREAGVRGEGDGDGDGGGMYVPQLSVGRTWPTHS